MIEPFPSASLSPKVGQGRTKQQIKKIKNKNKNKTKRRNSDVSRFQYKVIVLFHVKLKMFL